MCAGSFEDPFHDKQRALLPCRGHETRTCCTVRSAVEVSMLLTQMQAAGANASASHPGNAETLLVCNDGGIQGVGSAITTSSLAGRAHANTRERGWCRGMVRDMHEVRWHLA